MSKRHSRLIEYFITVGIEFDQVEPINDDSITYPIRELRIISSKEVLPSGFERILTTITGRDASLTKKGILGKNLKYYLCYTREGTSSLFTRIQYTSVKNNIGAEWKRCPGRIVSGKSSYCLCTRNDLSVPPIADICIITVDGKEVCPPGYIKMPSTMPSSLAICFRHLPMDALGLRYKTHILDRYPLTDYASSPLSNTTAVFCQPNGADIRINTAMPTFLSFVLTDHCGRKMYAITVTFYDCMTSSEQLLCQRSLLQIYTDGFKPSWPQDSTTLYHSKSVCILSYYPFFLSFREVLKEIYRVANSPGNIPIERYIINLCEEIPLPIPSFRSIQLKYAHKPIIFKLADDNELPLLDSNLKKIFNCLSLNNVLLLYRVLLTQKYKILITSSHISLITEICEDLISFLQPFEWQFSYVPVLPYAVIDILDAPVPVLVGMHSSRITCKPDYYSNYDYELIIVDLDNNQVHIPHNTPLIDIPSQSFKSLKHNLKQYSHANKVQLYDKNSIQFVDSAFGSTINVGDDDNDDDDKLFNPLACRAAFYRFWIKILGPNYKEYLIFPDDDDICDIYDLFNLNEFILSRPKYLRKFIKKFSETQGFQKFIEDLTYESTEERAVSLKAFYKCTQYEYKDNNNNTINKPSSPVSVSLSSQSASVAGNHSSPITKSKRSSSSKSKTKTSSFNINNSLDNFVSFLNERINNLNDKILPFQVKPPNKDNLDDNYKYKVTNTFPMLNDKYLIKPRITNLYALIEKEEKEEKTKKHIQNNKKRLSTKSTKIILNDKHPIGRQRSNNNNNNNMTRQKTRTRSAAKYQTPLDRAKFQLLQIYGTWFAAHVASLDFKDIAADEVELTVKNTLNVLYSMTTFSNSNSNNNNNHMVMIIPDELIYKSCLILCGKFGKKKEASSLFKDLKKNGITPSQKTYGAYTNAMASSGANMLLSAAGSTSSGASSLIGGRTHRRSFAPTADGLNINKTRSLSAVINQGSRLNATKINTISEDKEMNNKNDNNNSNDVALAKMSKLKNVKSVGSPTNKQQNINNNKNKNNNDYFEEEKLPISLSKVVSSPLVPLSQLDEDPPFVSNKINKSVDITLSTTATKTKQNQLSIMNSESTPTPAPKIGDDPPPLPSSDDDQQPYMNGNIHHHNNNPSQNLDITPVLWKSDDDDDDDDDGSADEKQSQPNQQSNGSSMLSSPVAITSSSYSTRSVLSTQTSASVSQTPEPASATATRTSQPILNTNNVNLKLKQQMDRIAIIIDYSTLEIEAYHECKCGYILSDAQIMVGWCSEFTPSITLKCIICRQNSFDPRLHLKYNITKMSMKNGICSFEIITKYIEYISPLQLRSKINNILQHRRLDFEDPEIFRKKHENEFFNMIWYFYHQKLDLTFLIGEQDANLLQINPFNKKNKSKSLPPNTNNPSDDDDSDDDDIDDNNDNDNKLEPKSDDDLLKKLQPIYKKGINKNLLRNAISEWLLNRSQTLPDMRDKSIWNLSVFDSFHDLGIHNKYSSYETFIIEFKKACRNIRPKMKDRAWSEPSLAIQKCFKHPRRSNIRLYNISKRLNNNNTPKRPNIPVPTPPNKSNSKK